MSQIRKVGKFTYWCSKCQMYLVSDETTLNHTHKLSQELSGIERHWLEEEQGDAEYDSGDAEYDRELMKRIGIRWP